MDTFALDAGTAGAISGVVGFALLGALVLVILGNTPTGKRVAKSIGGAVATRSKERKTLKAAANRGKTAARAKHAKETAQAAEEARLDAGPQPGKLRRGLNGFKSGVAAIGKGADAISSKTNPRLAAALMGSANKAKPGGGRIRRALAGRLLSSVYPGDGDAGNSTPDPPSAGTPKPAATAPATPTSPATPASPAPTTPTTPAPAGPAANTPPTSNVTPFPRTAATTGGASMIIADQARDLARRFAEIGQVNLDHLTDKVFAALMANLAMFGHDGAAAMVKLSERLVAKWNVDHRVTAHWADAAVALGTFAAHMNAAYKKWDELYDADRRRGRQGVAQIVNKDDSQATADFFVA